MYMRILRCWTPCHWNTNDQPRRDATAHTAAAHQRGAQVPQANVPQLHAPRPPPHPEVLSCQRMLIMVSTQSSGR